MKEIFTGLYNKVISFFQKQEEAERKENVKEVAYNRLKLVLMQDRTNLTPLLLERMRGEMIEVLSKYVEMDKDALELNFEQEGDSMALMLSIPVLRAKDEAEIQAALDKEDAKKEAQEEDKCAECDCEYKESDIECKDCPKVFECECVEDVCATCDCEFKDSNIECKDCPKASDCECKKEFDEAQKNEEENASDKKSDGEESSEDNTSKNNHSAKIKRNLKN